jgi:CHAT domain-containing protein
VVNQLRFALAQRPQAGTGRGNAAAVIPLEAPDPQPLAQQLYQWLLRDLEQTLKDSHTDTLVFVLDGALRNIPMAVLYDGKQYLIEKYAVALTPGLQLINPRPLAEQRVQAIVGALSEARQNFSAIPAVKTEVAEIKSQVPTVTLLNEQFQKTPFRQTVNNIPFPIVHLATHGQFSSNAENTFVLTWDDRLNVNELSAVLQTSELARKHPIELLILSACETAAGDDRAALGLAGVAVRAGARSTLASLWVVDDTATSTLMKRLYGELGHLQRTKAQAVRQAQLELLHSQDYTSPYYWAPFVLVGNWL